MCLQLEEKQLRFQMYGGGELDSVSAINEGKKLDQFFTKNRSAFLCWENLLPVICKITGNTTDNLFFIEPSAGNGAFYNLLPPENRFGLDLEPLCEGLVQNDFLSWQFSPLSYSKKDTVVIGNPPFGKRGNLAVKFFNKAATVADTIAFIVPVIFRKYFIHKQLNSGFQWISSVKLSRDAFYTRTKDSYDVNTEFQIWTRLKNSYQNNRLFFSAPNIP